MAERDLHSGFYGGAVPNAAHVLLRMLDAVAPDPEGRARPELSAGVVAPSAEESESWEALPDGARAIADVGAQPVSPDAAGEFYERTGALASVDVNMVQVGEPRTIVPAAAHGHVSVRLAPGQSAAQVGAELERLLREAAHPAAEVSIETKLADPAFFDTSHPALQLGAEAIGRACGSRDGVRAAGRHAAPARRAGRAPDPGDSQRLRAAGGRLPRAQRELPSREPAPGRGRGA